MSLICFEGAYEVLVPYSGPTTIKNLIQTIQEGEQPEEFVDARLTDEHFPQGFEGDVASLIEVVSFNPGWSSKEDGVGFLRARGYIPATAAELLALRAQYPGSRFSRSCIATVCPPWRDTRNYPYIPCLGNCYGNGLRLRISTGGFVSFWKFAVKKAESE